MRGRAQRVQQYVPALRLEVRREVAPGTRWKREEGCRREEGGEEPPLSARSYAIN